MPPQQGYRLPDLVDDILRFRAHAGCSILLLKMALGRRDT